MVLTMGSVEIYQQARRGTSREGGRKAPEVRKRGPLRAESESVRPLTQPWSLHPVEVRHSAKDLQPAYMRLHNLLYKYSAE